MKRFRHQPSYVKEFLAIACIITVFGILALSLFGPSGYGEMQKSRLERRERQGRVNALMIDNHRRKENIEALRSDPDAQERKARENGYVRENEIIQRLPE